MATSPFAAPLGMPVFSMFDNAGNPLNGGFVQTYIANTATPLATYPTYQDALAGTNPNTNPVLLDPFGRANIWLQAGLFYKVVVTDSGGTPIQTTDYVSSASGYPQPYTTEWTQERRAPVAFVAINQFQITGVDATADYHLRRRVYAVNSGGIRYGTVTASAFTAGNTLVTVAQDAGNYDVGLSAVYLGWNSFVNPSYLSPRTLCNVYKSGNQTGFAATTKVNTWLVNVDTNNEWLPASNRWVAKYPGTYLAIFQMDFSDTVVSVAVFPQLYLSGNLVRQAAERAWSVAGNVTSVTVHHTFTCNAGDYIEAFCLGTVNTTVVGPVPPLTSTQLTIMAQP